MGTVSTFVKALGIIKDGTKEDIKIQHIDMLCALYEAHPNGMSFVDLGKASGSAQASVSRAVKTLGVCMVMNAKTKEWKDIGMGLIRSEQDPRHPRQFEVSLTDKGLALMRKLEQALK